MTLRVARLSIIVALVALFSCPALAALATPACDWRSSTVALLEQEYSESVAGVGIMSGGRLVELLTSEKSWTLLLTMPNGVTCMIAAGEDWQRLPPKKKGEQS